MTNDAKLGLLTGVAGVVVAAALWTTPPQPPPDTAGRTSHPPQATPPHSVAEASGGLPVANTPAPLRAPAPLPSSPVARTHTDVPALPTSHAVRSDDEEP
jgi:hypothetical protein